MGTRKGKVASRPKLSPSPLHAAGHALARQEAALRLAAKAGTLDPAALKRAHRKAQASRRAFRRPFHRFDPFRGDVELWLPWLRSECDVLAGRSPVFRTFAHEGVTMAVWNDQHPKRASGSAECPMGMGVPFGRVSFGFLSYVQFYDRRSFNIRSHIRFTGDMEILGQSAAVGGGWSVRHQLIVRMGYRTWAAEALVDEDSNDGVALDAQPGWAKESTLEVAVCLPFGVVAGLIFEEAVIVEATKFGPEDEGRSFAFVDADFDPVGVTACSDC